MIGLRTLHGPHQGAQKSTMPGVVLDNSITSSIKLSEVTSFILFELSLPFVSELPIVAEEFHPSDTVITVADSKLGWAKAYKELVGLLYIGQIPKWDLSKVRPAGAPLKTFGGRASRHAPLENLFNFNVTVFKGANGR